MNFLKTPHKVRSRTPCLSTEGVFFFFQSVMSLKINPVLLLKFAVSSSHKNVSLISVKTVQQDKVKLSNFSSGGESILCPEQSSSWEVSRRQTCCFSGQSVLVWMLLVCFRKTLPVLLSLESYSRSSDVAVLSHPVDQGVTKWGGGNRGWPLAGPGYLSGAEEGPHSLICAITWSRLLR